MLKVPNFTIEEKINTIDDLLNIEKGSFLIVVEKVMGSNAEYISLIALIFTIAITYVKTNNEAAVAYVTLLLSALMLGFVKAIVLKVAYIVFILAAAYILYRIYSKEL